MSICVERQVASALVDEVGIPDETTLQTWVSTVLKARCSNAEVTLRFVDRDESAALNAEYRHKTGATNVLSFSSEVPAAINTHFLGDLVFCVPVIQQEAKDQKKTLQAHYAHLTVHGILHLLGYDHQTEQEATEMERLEIDSLENLNINNPYLMDRD